MTDVLRFDASAQPDGRTDRWFRTALFVVAFLLIWITISPFSDLGDLDHVESTNAGNLAGQLATLALTAAMVVFIVRHQPQLLTKAVTPILIVTLAWFALSGAFSHYPELSIRRVILAALTIFQAVVFLMLAPTREEFARLLALCSLVILGLVLTVIFRIFSTGLTGLARADGLQRAAFVAEGLSAQLGAAATPLKLGDRLAGEADGYRWRIDADRWADAPREKVKLGGRDAVLAQVRIAVESAAGTRFEMTTVTLVAVQ